MTEFDETIKKGLENLHGNFIEAMKFLKGSGYYRTKITCSGFYHGSYAEVEFSYDGEKETDYESLCLYLFFTNDVHGKRYPIISNYAMCGDWLSLIDYIDTYSAVFQPRYIYGIGDEREPVFFLMDNHEFLQHCSISAI